MTPIVRAAALGLCGLVFTSTVVAADTLPRRKPGLWEVSVQMVGLPGGPHATSHCIDEKTDEAMQNKALSGGDRGEQQCSPPSVKRSGNAVDVVADCSSKEGKSHIVSHLSGDMQSSYAGTTTITFDPPRHGRSEMKMEMSARYAGACPADMKPGDLRVGGVTVNPGQPGAGRPALPGGMDMSKLMNMSPEERKQMIEQMRQGMAPKTP